MLLNLIQVMSIRDRKLIIESFEIKDIVDQVLLSLKTIKKFEQIKVSIHQLVKNTFRTDRELMIITLTQLIENSIFYSCETDPEIQIRILNDDHGNLLLEVADNGTGIPAEALEKVFDMFYRGTLLSKGSGLGLYLVKNAVERLGGHIKVSSEENKGATFAIHFST